MTIIKLNNQLFGIRQTPLTLQQRLRQLIGAKLNVLINPFGNVEDAKILKVLKSVIVVGEKPGTILSPLGLQIIGISRRAKNPTTKKFSIGVNAKVEEGKPNTPTILNNLRIVQIGKDFLEVTSNGRSILLIPLSNVTIIFPTPKSNKRPKWKKNRPTTS